MHIIFFLVILFLFLSPSPVFAHAFGQQYMLPVPFWLYAYGAAAAVIVSFFIIGFFVNEKKKDILYPTLNISKSKIIRIITNSPVVIGIKVLSILLFILTLITGFFGTSVPVANFNMTFFWIIFILGVTYVSALIGNIYSIINPLKISADFIEYLLGRKIKGIITYPTAFAYYPALFLYFLFIFTEILGRINPYDLSVSILGYCGITFLGIVVFGKDTWLEHGDFLKVFFTLLSKVSILNNHDKKFCLRLPFVGLLSEKTRNFSLLLFILFMLSSTAFDGFKETIKWFDLYFAVTKPFINQLGDFAPQIVGIIGLFLSPFIFLTLYIVFIFLMKLTTHSSHSIKELAFSFMYSLIPIALVYNIAHYYTLLVIQGQLIISLISDPFGFGWNLFKTAYFTPNIGIINVNFIWHSQVAAILFGHIVAVYLAHVIALQMFSSHKKAVISQFPMLILMVTYTVIGLWILSQPLTSGF